ncbi:WhiB family transcription factor [Microbacterium phage Fede]|nr:WhiB family transcription factor [Microbacterium phage Fede]
MVARIYADTVDISSAKEREEWMSRASCVNRNPEIFFAEGKGSVASQTDKAKKICREICPVRQECLAKALADEKGGGRRYGVSGGYTATEREQLQSVLDEMMKGQSNGSGTEGHAGEDRSSDERDGDSPSPE